MTDRAIHWITTGSGAEKAGFVTSDVYSEIGAVLGVTKLADADTADMNSVSNLIRYGKMMRLRVRYEDADGDMASATVLCDIDKAPTAIAGLRGKSFKGGTIRSANIIRRRRLG